MNLSFSRHKYLSNMQFIVYKKLKLFPENTNLESERFILFHYLKNETFHYNLLIQ